VSAPGGKTSGWRRLGYEWLVPLVVALVTVGAFASTVDNDFVKWDDPQNFLENTHYRGLSLSHLRWMWTTAHMGHYMPVTWLTLGLDYEMWGLDPAGYHLTSLLLHAVAAVVFYGVAVSLLATALPGAEPRALRIGAAFAAVVFAVHPLRVESVAWATERRDVLCGVFYLGAILAYLRHVEKGKSGRWYWTSVLCAALAVLSKSMAVSLSAVLVILDVYPLRRLGPGAGGWLGPAQRRVWAEKLPFVLLSLGGSVGAVVALRAGGVAPTSLAELSLPGRAAVTGYSVTFYLWKTLLPTGLSPLYELPFRVHPLARSFVLAGLFALVASVIVVVGHRRAPALAATWAVYLVALLPVIGIVHNGPQLVADRYSYLPCLGWALLAGAALTAMWRRTRIGATATAACVAAVLCWLTWNQVQIWRDSEALWTHALRVSPSARAHVNLGNMDFEDRKDGEAAWHFREALRLQPTLAAAYAGLGVVRARHGQLAEAIADYQTALRFDPKLAEAHNDLGVAFDRQGRVLEALNQYEEAVRLRPGLEEASANLERTRAYAARLADEIERLQATLRERPDEAGLHNRLGAALARRGSPAEAIAHFRRALELDPRLAEAHNNWGSTLAQEGRLDEAAQEFRRALTVQPDFPEARRNLGRVLEIQGRAEPAR